MNTNAVKFHSGVYFTFSFLCLFLLADKCSAQQGYGIIKGRLFDIQKLQAVNGVSIESDSSQLKIVQYADGHYSAKVKPGTYRLSFSHPDYNSFSYTGIKVKKNEIVHADVNLMPVIDSIASDETADSSANQQKKIYSSFKKEMSGYRYNPILRNPSYQSIIEASSTGPGTDKNASELLKRLNGVILTEDYSREGLQTLTIAGMGQRYNQVMLNGLPLMSYDRSARSYPLFLIPSEAIKSVGLQATGDVSLPSGFAGGTVHINTVDIPERNFWYAQIGSGFSDNTIGETFYSDNRNRFELLSFPGKHRDLPSAFPTTKSEFSISEKNIQERVDLARQLKNNFRPERYGPSNPNQKTMIGFGRVRNLKGNGKWGVTAYITHQKSERIDESTTLVAPDLVSNPYPYDNSLQLIKAQSNDLNYRYNSSLSGIANFSLMKGHSTFSFRNFFGSMLDNRFTRRTGIVRPDEDPMANAGIGIQSQHTKFWNTQISGEHLLGEQRRLRFNWRAAYTINDYDNPDEHNFLLRQDQNDTSRYEIATQPAATNLTRTGRLWRGYTEHHFSGAFDLSIPLRFLQNDHVLSGGVFTETIDRILTSDLVLTQGNGYYPLGEILSPDRYYPGGASISNYYTKAVLNAGQISFPEYVRGNYQVSSSLGAPYMKLQSHFKESFLLDLGLRLESYNHLVSNIQYYYLEGYKNAQFTSIDANADVISFSLLPSINLTYKIFDNLHIGSGYCKTVNRPLLQELSYHSYYDPATFTVNTGNPYLRNSEIFNYDAQIKWLPDAGSSIMLKGFYREITQPIEKVLTPYETGTLITTPYNTAGAFLRGLTADVKINFSTLLASDRFPLSIYAGATWQDATVKEGDIRNESIGSISRHSLTGSPELMVNAGLVIHHSSFPQLTVNYSRIGDYITALGTGSIITLENGNSITAIPDYRMKERDQLDLQISHKFLSSRLQLIAGAHNLLKNDLIQYQDLNGNKKYDDKLIVTSPTDAGTNGFFVSGTDNTTLNIRAQRTYYLTLSYLFN